MDTISQIAKTCHSIHRAYCIAIGHKTQPVWEETSHEHKTVVISSIVKIINGDVKSYTSSHENFVKLKEEQGWVYGEVYNETLKINPRLVEFNALSEEHKTKEILFFECVMSFNN